MKLIICGNGFDLHHGFKTGYHHYKNFLEAHYQKAIRDFEDFPYINLSVSNKWSDLESSLSLDYDDCLGNAIAAFYPDMNDDSDSRWYGIDVELEQQTEFIFNFTGPYFIEWLAQTDFSNPSDLIPLDKGARYITFNYTGTLENIYGVGADNIFHIHGQMEFAHNSGEPNHSSKRNNMHKTGRGFDDIQFGSIENDSDVIQRELEQVYGEDDFFSVSIEPGIHHIIGFCEAASKKLENNYDDLTHFIKTAPIDEVVVMGHSLIGVDGAYYSNVIVPLLADSRWVFYWYSEFEKSDILKFVDLFSIREYELIKW